MAKIVIENAITENGTNIIESFDRENQFLAVIQVDITRNMDKKLNMFTSSNIGKFKIIDRDGVERGNFTINFTGTSLYSDNMAYSSAILDLKSQFAKEYKNYIGKFNI